MPQYAGPHESNEAVQQRVGRADIADILRQRRLRWYWHVRWMEDVGWPWRMMGVALPGKVVQGKWLTWEGLVEKDCVCVLA